MKLLSFLVKNKSNTYFDLSSRERKKIVKKAVKKANEEQAVTVQKYSNKYAECNICK